MIMINWQLNSNTTIEHLVWKELFHYKRENRITDLYSSIIDKVLRASYTRIIK